MKCPKCDGVMDIGFAIKPKYPEGCLFIMPPSKLRFEDIEFIDCYKCTKCGHSDDGVDPTKLMGSSMSKWLNDIQ